MERIVHLIFTLESGGSENMLVDIANVQASLAEVSIILINKKYSIDLVGRISPSVHFYSLQRKEGDKRSILFLFRLWGLLLRIRPTVIHCHNHNIIRLLPMYRKRTVLTIHCLKAATVHLKKYRKVYSISGAVSDDISVRAGIKSPVVLNGINFLDIFPRMNYLCAENMPIRIVQVGRMVHEIKGQHLLLRALYKLIILEKHNNIYVDLIGSGPSLPYLQSLTDTLKLNGHVSFLGERSRYWIYERLSSYHMLIQPSLSEGFGLTVLEGIAAGLPVIASDQAGPSEILSNIPNGYLFRSGDEDDLADTIRKVIAAMQEGKMKRLCEASREIADKRYSIRRTAFEYLQHYSLL
ncbi:MAG TPA: glycosyltransferase [Puia sp.]|nr:glycosyltransferase [Puia sp.]